MFSLMNDMNEKEKERDRDRERERERMVRSREMPKKVERKAHKKQYVWKLQ